MIRTFALHRKARHAQRPYDLGSGAQDQVYGGVGAETPRVVAAVAATRRQILTHRGEPILSAFHSAAGGRTASAEEVWGQALPVSRELAGPPRGGFAGYLLASPGHRHHTGRALSPRSGCASAWPGRCAWSTARRAGGRCRVLLSGT